MRQFTRRQAARVGAAGVLAGLAGARDAGAQSAAPLDALIQAARAEGEVLLYCSATDSIARRATEGFTRKYGIKSAYLRLASTALLQRFSAESQAGSFPSDLLLINIGAATASLDASWTSTMADARLPILDGNDYNKNFLKSNYALVQIAPWQLGYNSDRLKAADVPTDWTGLLDPKFKGQILIPEIMSSDSYIEFWAAMFDRYGADFFARLRAQTPRFFSSGTPAMQALAAGEGLVAVPTLAQTAIVVTDKGAPVVLKGYDYTTGSEIGVMLPNLAKTKHPNAARLFANYLMSAEGNSVLNAEPGSISVYDTGQLPKQYRFEDAKNAARREEIRKLFGQG